jgi:hypothetical protein
MQTLWSFGEFCLELHSRGVLSSAFQLQHLKPSESGTCVILFEAPPTVTIYEPEISNRAASRIAQLSKRRRKWSSGAPVARRTQRHA